MSFRPSYEDLASLFDDAADVLLVRGWRQKSKGRPDRGPVCAFGALHVAAQGEQPVWLGDARIVRLLESAHSAVFNKVEVGPASWNDAQGRTVDEVIELFRKLGKEARNEGAA